MILNCLQGSIGRGGAHKRLEQHKSAIQAAEPLRSGLQQQCFPLPDGPRHQK